MLASCAVPWRLRFKGLGFGFRIQGLGFFFGVGALRVLRVKRGLGV